MRVERWKRGKFLGLGFHSFPLTIVAIAWLSGLVFSLAITKSTSLLIEWLEITNCCICTWKLESERALRFRLVGISEQMLNCNLRVIILAVLN